MGEILKNLNIRKFTSKSAYDSATVGENDLCVLLDGSKPVLQVTMLPAASADEVGNVYQYVGSTAAGLINGYFYACVNNGGGGYTWQHVLVQPNANYSTYIYNSLEMTRENNAIRLFPYVRTTGLYNNDTGEVLIRIAASGALGEFVAKITKSGNANVRSRVYVATGIFATARVYLQATSASSTTRYICIEKDDGSPFLSGTGMSSSFINYYMNSYGVNENTYSGIYAGLYSHAPTYMAWRTLTEEDKPTQYTEFPTIRPYNLGEIAQYVGTTTASYTNGYFYQASGTLITQPDSMVCVETTSTGTTITPLRVSSIPYWLAENTSLSYAGAVNAINSGAVFSYDADNNTFGFDSYSFAATPEDVAQYFSFSPALTSGQISWNAPNGYIPEHQEVIGGSWERIDVQPSSGYKVPTSVPDLLDTDWVLDSGTGKYNQTINVTGVTATNTVFVSPSPVSADDWASSNILCTTQGAGTLTFTCDTVPSTSGGGVGVNVVIFG